jgi:signal transduction histidine kinase
MKAHHRIALILFLSYLLIVALFGSAIYYFQNEYSYIDFYKRLDLRTRIATSLFLNGDSLSTDPLIDFTKENIDRLPKEKEFIIEVNEKTDLAAEAAARRLSPEFLSEVLENGRARLKNRDNFYNAVKKHVNGRTYIIGVSAENYYVSNHLYFLRNVVAFGAVVILLLTLVLSRYLSRRVFAPIKKITAEVRRISAGSMQVRLKQHEQHSEIAELVSTFNDLLNRLDTAFQAQSNFISNASHELATPLTAIIGEADVTLIKDRTEEEYRESMRNVLDHADRLDQITKSLLFLAETGYGRKPVKLEELRIDEMLWEVKHAINRLNPANKILIDSTNFPDDPTRLKINGNKPLLRMAFANLMNNACKYSNDKPVNVSVTVSAKRLAVVIRDQGIGIPAEEMPHILDPFYRASNTGLFEGHGIGLHLAQNIIYLHNGTLQVTSEINVGTTVEVKLPLSRPLK